MWRLAIAERQWTGGAILVGACLIGLAAMSRTEPTADECRFEQTWYAGDVHFNEQIEFRGDSTGTWMENGAAGDAPRERKDFRWSRTGSTLTVDYDGDQQRSVEYHVEPHSTVCWLRFSAHPFLVDDSGFLLFENRR